MGWRWVYIDEPGIKSHICQISHGGSCNEHVYPLKKVVKFSDTTVLKRGLLLSQLPVFICRIKHVTPPLCEWFWLFKTLVFWHSAFLTSVELSPVIHNFSKRGLICWNRYYILASVVFDFLYNYKILSSPKVILTKQWLCWIGSTSRAELLDSVMVIRIWKHKFSYLVGRWVPALCCSSRSTCLAWPECACRRCTFWALCSEA